jgi:hypothetical protein
LIIDMGRFYAPIVRTWGKFIDRTRDPPGIPVGRKTPTVAADTETKECKLVVTEVAGKL